MNIIILNGSPRKDGNTACAVNLVKEGLLAKDPHQEISIIDVPALGLKGCFACDECMKNGGTCVIPDGGAEIIEKIAKADMVVFASPVYWWGISSQLKALLDRCYSKDQLFHSQKKKVGVIAIGAAGTSDPEYKLISDQFKCICSFLGWEIVLDLSISAGGLHDLVNNKQQCESIRNAAENI